MSPAAPKELHVHCWLLVMRIKVWPTVRKTETISFHRWNHVITPVEPAHSRRSLVCPNVKLIEWSLIMILITEDLTWELQWVSNTNIPRWPLEQAVSRRPVSAPSHGGSALAVCETTTAGAEADSLLHYRWMSPQCLLQGTNLISFYNAVVSGNVL